MQMSRIARGIVIAAMACGLITAGAIPAAAARPAAHRVTIGASSRYPGGPVAGHTLVSYRTASYDTATISGDVTGFAKGDVVTLLARPFRAARFRAEGTPVTLT